jgi:hypothetical protein
MPFVHYQTSIFVTPFSFGGDQVAVYKDDSNNLYRVHFYYNNGTFRAFNDLAPGTQVDIYVQGGGGGGANATQFAVNGGGGGAGQWNRFLTRFIQNNTDCNIVVGRGGLPGLPGGLSSFLNPSGPTYSSPGGTPGDLTGAGTPNNGRGGAESQGGFSASNTPPLFIIGGGGGGGTNTGGTGQGRNGSGFTGQQVGGNGGVGRLANAGPFLTGPNGQRVQLFQGSGGGGGASRNIDQSLIYVYGIGSNGGGAGAKINILNTPPGPTNIAPEPGQSQTRGVFGPFGSGGGGGGGAWPNFPNGGNGADGWVAVVVPFEEG